jgi:hypothetical protein
VPAVRLSLHVDETGVGALLRKEEASWKPAALLPSDASSDSSWGFLATGKMPTPAEKLVDSARE